MEKYDYGMIGLGTMGRNLVLNMNDHGYSIAGFDKNNAQVETFKRDAVGRNVTATSDLVDFIKSLSAPRIIMMLVPAGKIVDDVINELKPFLSANDLLMDCGNSHFKDTNMRIDLLAQAGIHFMGVGISGGESGARYGPSIMPGGSKNAYDRVSTMLEAIAAKVNNEPCVTWLGPGSAGHYVKMVHNGIEYGLMQLISESYHLLKVIAKVENNELHSIFLRWNEGMLKSFLIEITAAIFAQRDDELNDHFLIDAIQDSAHQKGTGGWASEDAINLQVPISVIDLAVSMRNLSAYRKEREEAHQKLKGAEITIKENKEDLVSWLERSLYFSMIMTYAQGMALLATASKQYKYDLKLESIAKIWRGGCIIRSSLLEDIKLAFARQDLTNLLLSDRFSQKLSQAQNEIRKVIQIGIETGIPLPAMMASLAYFDSYRSGWLPANLIQAQRDYFGAHTYERNDRKGIFHTNWNQKVE